MNAYEREQVPFAIRMNRAVSARANRDVAAFRTFWNYELHTVATIYRFHPEFHLWTFRFDPWKMVSKAVLVGTGYYACQNYQDWMRSGQIDRLDDIDHILDKLFSNDMIVYLIQSI